MFDARSVPLVRSPIPDDALAWAEFLARSQAATYDSLMPAGFGARQLAEAPERAADLAEQFADATGGGTGDDTVRRIAEVGGHIVGVAAAGPAPLSWELGLGLTPAPADWQLQRLYLDPAWHGTGLADRLLAEVLTDDRDVYLWIIDGNDRAQRFYRRHGFTDLEEKVRAGESWGSVPMHRMVRGRAA